MNFILLIIIYLFICILMAVLVSSVHLVAEYWRRIRVIGRSLKRIRRERMGKNRIVKTLTCQYYKGG